jgi:hypothetical protein
MSDPCLNVIYESDPCASVSPPHPRTTPRPPAHPACHRLAERHITRLRDLSNYPTGSQGHSSFGRVMSDEERAAKATIIKAYAKQLAQVCGCGARAGWGGGGGGCMSRSG